MYDYPVDQRERNKKTKQREMKERMHPPGGKHLAVITKLSFNSSRKRKEREREGDPYPAHSSVIYVHLMCMLDDIVSTPIYSVMLRTKYYIVYYILSYYISTFDVICGQIEKYIP